ncbi:MAG: DUF4159 domain-containing protein [Planctomycetota bacterium]|nr:DUF4159 domain-containing protein [Planctomycetota bacterium]
MILSRLKSDRRLAATAISAVVWLVSTFDWLWMGLLPPWGLGVAFGVSAVAAAAWLRWAFRSRAEQRILSAAVASFAFIPVWQFAVYSLDLLEMAESRALLARFGTAVTYLIGLAWVVWGLEQAARKFDRERRNAKGIVAAEHVVDHLLKDRRADVDASVQSQPWLSNPLDPEAWYYGKKSKRLNQSVAAFLGYSLAFFVAFLILTQVGGCQDIYEMPAGGGEQQQIAQVVKVQKVIRKKFVVNPFASISFNIPPIDEIKLQLTEITKHHYTVGYGAGAGAGFAGGTKAGKVRFIRIEYLGGDWDQDFGIGADVNMLIEYGVRTQQKVEKLTESRTVSQLKLFPVGKSPPYVYMTGQKSIQLSKSEIKILREYIIDKHGMLFGDNGGSRGWHNQFLSMMQQVLPNVRPTTIPLDDVIHRIPFQIPFLPYVAPHGGKESLGWRVDGRLVCYYHPGDIGDAWADDHSGVSPEVWEACYQLGTNVIFYAHTEYAKWLEARRQ